MVDTARPSSYYKGEVLGLELAVVEMPYRGVWTIAIVEYLDVEANTLHSPPPGRIGVAMPHIIQALKSPKISG